MISDFNLAIFALGVLIVLVTPGPTNTMLLAGGLDQGMRRALPLVVSELFGYIIAISVWGVALTPLQRLYPGLITAARVISSCYLIYIAINLWNTAKSSSKSGQKTIGPKALFVATLLNPKALLFSSVIFPAQAFASADTYFLAMAVFTCLLVPIGFVWIWCGAALGSGRLTIMSQVNLQRLAALIVGAFSVSVACVAFH